jgi:hypothetical protein
MIPAQTSLPKRSKLPLILIALCFFAPVVAAWFLQSPLSDFKATATKNFGDLITPVVPINRQGLQVLQSAQKSNAEAQWTMLYLPAPDCGTCAERIELLAHIRQATGRNIDRVNLEVISDRRFDLPPQAQISTFLAPAPQWQMLLNTLQLPAQGGLVILDPLGNAVMRFPADFDGTQVRKDLTRLLKVSQTGKSKSTGVMS